MALQQGLQREGAQKLRVKNVRLKLSRLARIKFVWGRAFRLANLARRHSAVMTDNLLETRPAVSDKQLNSNELQLLI